MLERLLRAGVVCCALVAGCSSADSDDSITTATTRPAVRATAPDDVDEILDDLEASGFCDPADVDDTGDIGEVTAMQFVVAGEPVAPCFGAVDDRLDDAWALLASIADADDLEKISLLAGYEACSGCDTLAFVSVLDEEGTFVLMAIDLTAAETDAEELKLTLLHELSHVITLDPTDQLDIDVEPETCATYHGGNGCFRSSSLMWAWIDEFWDDESLDAVSAADGSDESGGERRCDVDPAYTGSYGASSPEEDFAEVFSAFVFDVDLDPALDDKLAFFERNERFVRTRDRAFATGNAGVTNSFEGCG